MFLLALGELMKVNVVAWMVRVTYSPTAIAAILLKNILKG